MTPTAHDWPLVSCIMPTHDRRPFVPAAIRLFLRQDFPNKELVIVDDGTDAVGDLVPADSPIRYVRLSRRTTVGAKRNLACEQAAGSLIAHWDDDDWHAPRRLRCQVEALLDAGADLCGLKTLLFYDRRNDRAWRYAYPDDQRPWLSGSSLLYRRDFWTGHRFPEIDVGEDSQFVWRADPRRLTALADLTIHVGIIHGRNVAPKDTRGAWWRPHPVDEIRQILGDDWGADATVVAAPAPEPDSRDNQLKPPAPSGRQPFRNIFACLVHENLECIVDLVRNLHHLDPDSTILLYNGSSSASLLDGAFPFDRHGTVVHPSSKPMRWGRLHDFALDCMRFALAELPFDAMTIVDSDQLALRPGYSARLATFLAGEPGVGMLSNSPEPQGPGTKIQPPRIAHAEIDLWRPFLRRFTDGEKKFVHWGFWPSTVFTADAARDLVTLFDQDAELAQIMTRTRVWATEEVVLPTLVALMGYRVAANPCSFDFVRYRMQYSVPQLEAAMNRSDVFWAHPIPRRYDDPLRLHVRGRFQEYARPGAGFPAPPDSPPFVLTLPVLARMKSIEGWLDDNEADLLMSATAHALRELSLACAVVEVGSYCGRGTVVLASVVKAVRPSVRVWSIDPHDGRLGTADRYVTVSPSLGKLKANVAAAGLADIVEIVQARSADVAWNQPIGFLLIDGLHDYANVARDFHHFAPHLVDGGYVAFHDYAGYFPGVLVFVDELLAGDRYRKVCSVGTLIVVQKRAAEQAPAADQQHRS
jgi:Methyltransferase domain/Glycosyl transferase family 2